jgi:hypothetical protein
VRACVNISMGVMVANVMECTVCMESRLRVEKMIEFPIFCAKM